MEWFVFAFASAVFSAGAALSQKKVLFKTEALDFSLVVSILSLIISIPFFINISFASLSNQGVLILYIKSILGTFAFLCVMLVLKNFEISKALPLMVLTPGLVAIFAFIFLGDSLTVEEVFGVILLMIGTYVLEVSDNKNIFNSFKVVFKAQHYYYIVIALILFTISAVLDRLLLTDYKLPPESFMALQQLFFAMNFIIIFFLKRKRTSVRIILSNKNIFIWILVIAILTVGYRYTQIEATKMAPVALVLSVKRISVFFSAITGGKIFKEKNLFVRTAATLIMIAGALFLLNY